MMNVIRVIVFHLANGMNIAVILRNPFLNW